MILPQDSTAAAYTNARLRRLLNRLGACSEGRAWLGDRDLATAWAECPRGDWLLWIAVKIGVDRRFVVRAAAACAETALRFAPEGEDRPRLAIEAARRWADDPTAANLEAARVASRNAYAAAEAAYAYAAAEAAYAYAAAEAAYAAAAAEAAYAAAEAAYAAAYAEAAYAAEAARKDARQQALKRCADLVRETIPLDIIVQAVMP